MDGYSLMPEKPQAMEICNQKKKTMKPLIQAIFHRALATLLLGLFLSSPNWVPKLLVSIHHLLFIALPNTWATFLEPRCLFIICNIIIVVLVGQSMLLGSSATEVAPNIYEEYVEHTRSMRGLANAPKDELEAPMRVKMAVADQTKFHVVEEIVKVVEQEADGEDETLGQSQEKENNIEVHGKGYDQDEVKVEEDVNFFHVGDTEEDADDGAWPLDELNRRVEDFIARFKEQRRLEGRMLLCIESAA